MGGPRLLKKKGPPHNEMTTRRINEKGLFLTNTKKKYNHQKSIFEGFKIFNIH
jgi:hypothetical protein